MGEAGGVCGASDVSSPFMERLRHSLLTWLRFGIEFSPEVVKADGTVRKLAWRICNAKKVLAPYSMSSSRGRSTPRPNTPK